VLAERLLLIEMFKVPTKNVRGSDHERLRFPPQMIVDVLYYVSKGTSHAFNRYIDFFFFFFLEILEKEITSKLGLGTPK
jgi:hypothetical protein